MKDNANIRKTQSKFLPKLKKVLRRVPFARNALAMFYAMQDPTVPLAAKTTIAAALVYFIVPVDLIPDVLFPLGYTDDASVIAGEHLTVEAYLCDDHYAQADRWLLCNA